jgi:zinc protease
MRIGWFPKILASLTLLFAAVSAAAQTPQATPPPPSKPRSVQFPKPVEKTLANGLRVIVVQRSQMPLVTAQLLIKSGAEVDPPKLSGIADMTGTLLTRGTRTRSATQIAEAIEALGGRLNSGAGWDSSSVTMNLMSSRIEPAMEILSDIVRNPAFSQAEIDRLRGQYLNTLRVSLGQPGTVARYVASRVVFGDAPYGHPLPGTAESLPLIKREDIVALHATYYRPDNAILIIGGDIAPQSGFALAQKVFGDWTKPQAELPKITVSNPTASGNRRVVVIDIPGAGQAAVLATRASVNRGSPEYFRALVTNAVLTGYSGRLNSEIRIKRGLSYGAGSVLETRRSSGAFTASAQTKNESGAEVAVLTLAELSRLGTDGLADAELVTRKANLLGGFARTLETTDGLVGQVSALALYGLPLDNLNRFAGDVQAITPQDIKTFTSAQLSADTASVIVVGDSAKFLPDLKKQFPQVEVIPVADLDLNSASLRRPPAKN